MEPMATTKHILLWVCILPVTKPMSNWKRVARVAFVLALFLVTIFAVSAYITFVLENISTNLEDALLTFMAFITCSGLIYVMLVAFFIRHQVPSVFLQLSTIYSAELGLEEYHVLVQTNSTCEWIWLIYQKLVLGFIVSVFMGPIASVLFNWFIDGNLIVDHFYRPVKTTLPWNQETIFGYFGEQILINIMCVIYSIINGVLLLLFVSICLHHHAFYKIIKKSIDKWNQSNENKVGRKFIANLIRFHISCKKLFFLSATVYSPFMVNQLTTGVIMLAVVIFQFDIQLQNHNYLAILLMFIGFMVGIMILFPYCYFGKLATENFEKMFDCTYDLNWPDLPVKLQKSVILLLANMERPMFYHGFKIATLDLNTFIQLLRMVVSYYLMFKTITSQ